MSDSKVVDPLSMSLDQLAAAKRSKRSNRGGGGGGGGGQRRGDRNRKRGNNGGSKRGNNNNSSNSGKRKSTTNNSNQQQDSRNRKKRRTEGGGRSGGQGSKHEADSYEIPARRGKKGQVVQATELKKPKAGGRSAKSAAEVIPSNPLPGLTTGVTVRVKNLNKDIMEEDLQELFAFYGEVKSVQLVKGKGIANIKFRRRAEAEDAVKKLSGRALDGTPMHVSIPLAGAGLQPESASNRGAAAKENKVICHFCGKVGHMKRECPMVKRLQSRRCHICGKKGHIQTNCPTLKGTTPPGLQRCHVCKKPGHFKRECPQVLSGQKSADDAGSSKRSGKSVEDLDADLQSYMAKAGEGSK